MTPEWYEGASREVLIDLCARMESELTMVWRWYDNLQHWVLQTVPCGYCGAGDAEWCRTRTSGKRASYLHADRHWQMMEIRGEWNE